MLVVGNAEVKSAMNKLREMHRAIQRLFARFVMWFWSLFSPCCIGWKEYDHEWKYIDDSYDHEYGTEQCGHWECQVCGAIDEAREPPEYEPWDDYDLGTRGQW